MRRAGSAGLSAGVATLLAAAVLAPATAATANPDGAPATHPASTIAVTPGNDVQVLQVTSAGQPVRATFTGTAGRIPTVNIVDDSLAHPAKLTLVPPKGQSSSLTVAASTFHVFDALKHTGQYSLVLTPAPSDTGQVSLLLTYEAAKTSSLPIGTDRTVSLPRPGEVQAFTFAGRLNRRPTLTMGQVNWVSATGATEFPHMNVDVYSPDGVRWGDFESICGNCSNDWKEIRREGGASTLIDVPGTWTLVFRGGTDETGSQTFQLNLVADQAREIVPGAITTTTVATRGQNVSYTFHGTAGQRPVLDTLSRQWQDAFFPVECSLLRPDGSSFASLTPSVIPMPSPDWNEAGPLDVTGDWTLVFDPDGPTTGSQQIVLGLVTDPAPTPVSLGTPITVSVPTAGVNADLTFPGVPGQRIVLNVSASSWSSLAAGGTEGSGSVSATLSGPDGAQVGWVQLPASGPAVVDLPSGGAQTGTWTLHLDPGTDSVGTTTFSLATVTDVTETVALDQAFAVNLDQPYQQGNYAFAFTGSNFVQATVVGSTFSDVTLSIVGSDGQTWGSSELTSPGDTSVLLAGLFVPDTYTLVVNPAGDETGSMTVTLSLF